MEEDSEDKRSRKKKIKYLNRVITKRLGRPVNAEFETEVWNECVFMQCVKLPAATSESRASSSDNTAKNKNSITVQSPANTAGSTVLDAGQQLFEDQFVIVANCAYSYSVVKTCAQIIRNRIYKREVNGVIIEEKKWLNNPVVKKLKFTNRWVFGALKRKRFRRRRVTSNLKPEMSEQEVNEQLALIQADINRYSLTASEVHNEDETGIHWAEEIKYQYCPKSAERGQSPPGDETGRFTGILGASGEGRMLPLMMIAKVKCKNHFQSAGQVLWKQPNL